VAAGEGDDVIGIRAVHRDRPVVAEGEDVRMRRAQLQQMPRPGEFDPAVAPAARERRPVGGSVSASAVARAAKSTGRRLSGSTSAQSQNSVP